MFIFEQIWEKSLKKIEIHRDFIDIKWRLKSTKELSYINNETNLTNNTWTSPLNNSGTINVEAGATLKLAGQVNAATKAYQNKVGTINISGTVITDTPRLDILAVFLFLIL